MWSLSLGYLNLFQEMAAFLAVMFLFIYLLSKIKPIADVMLIDKHHILSRIFYIAIFGSAVVLASIYTMNIQGVKINFRDSIAICADIIGGPSVGIMVGLIGGIFRFTLGGWTVGGCSFATFIAGTAAAYIVHRRNITIEKINYKSIFLWAGVALLYQIVHVVIFTPILAFLMGTRPTYYSAFVGILPFIAPMLVVNGVAAATILGLFHSIIVINHKNLKV